jgi:serine/threonine-protein kinase
MAELEKLGRYRLGKVLGRGAMGVVYEGLDPSLNRRVAIKTILKNAAIDTETARMYSAQFAREAQAAGRLNHPNIVQVHDFAEEGEIAYLVMEYIQGRELRSFFDAREEFAPAEAVRIMCELLDALDFAHEAGVIHRDVKPANVMLDAQRRVKLADFGVARIQDSERSAAGTMVGTPAFMSPEQISGGKIDRRTDVFSAGVVFYQMLTGEQPFTGAGAWTVAKKIMQDDPPPASSVAKSVSPVFDGIVSKALAKKQADRYATAKEFAAALRGALAGDAQATVQLPAAPVAKPKAAAAPKASDAEVEFWRAIQNSTDAAEIEFYLEQFPEGTYAPLARHKIAKLREPAVAARGDAEQTVRLEAEARARQEAAAKAKQEADEQVRREAEARARRVAEEQALNEALEKTRREAAEKAKREAEEKARQAQALAKLRQQQEAARTAAAEADPDATVAIGRPAAPGAAAPVAQKKSFLLPALVGAAVIVAGIGIFLAMNRKPAPAPVAEAPANAPAAVPAKPAAPAVDEEKIRREIEDRVRREYADKSVAEQAAAKAAGEKAIAEKILAAKTEKAALEKAAAEKAAADKLLADKLAAAKSAGEKAALEKAAAEKAAADKAATEKLAADKAAAEKAAADKLALEKAAAEKAAAAKAVPSKPGLPAVGDRWVYEAREVGTAKRFTLTVEAKAVSGNTVTEVVQRSDSGPSEVVQRPVLAMSSPPSGIVNFAPYLRSFQELRDGQKLGDIDFQRLYRCNETAFRCYVVARVAGREKVSVKAGSFDTVKVVLELTNSFFGRSTAVEYRYWYADAVNRFVKYEMRVDNSSFPAPQMDVELVSYTHAGGR